MEAMAGHLYTASQADTSNPMFWLAIFFVTGLAAMIVIALAVGIVVSIKYKAIRKKAEQADVQVDLSSGSTRIDAQGIEGCGYCIVCSIALILGALGISLPIVLTQQAEDLILAIVMAVFGALCKRSFFGLLHISKPSSRARLKPITSLRAPCPP